MSDITPEGIAEHLHGRDLFINRAFAGFVDVAADGAVVEICFTPNRHLKHVYGTRHFRAVVVPGETVPDLAEVDRLNTAVNLLGGQLQGGAQAARDLGRVIDLTALEIRRAVRIANAGDPAAAMRVITKWASEAAWLDNLDGDEGGEPRD